MILKDLQAIVHGNVTLVQWNDEAEDFTILYSTTHFVMKYVPEHLYEREVVEIHADTNDAEQTFIHIELAEA